MLKDHADPATQRDGIAAQVEAEDAGIAVLQRHQRRDQLEERGLTAAVGTKQSEDFAARDREAHRGGARRSP